MAAVIRVRIPVKATFFYFKVQWQYFDKFESEQSCILYVPKAILNTGADSLVVRILRCGRSKSGSHPCKGGSLAQSVERRPLDLRV